MSARKISNLSVKSNFAKNLMLFLVIFATVFATANFTSPKIASALDQYDIQIQALKNQNADYSAKSADLATQDATLDDAISQLQTQIAQIQSEINANNQKIAKLKTQIADNEARIKDQSQTLADAMAKSYVTGSKSPLEVVASSKDLSDFVDKQAEQTAAKNHISSLISELNQIKQDLTSQKTTVEQELANQKVRQSQVAATKAEQQKLLDETKGQEANYQQLAAANNAKIKDLEKQQAAAIEAAQRAAAEAARKKGATNNPATQIVAGDPNHGGYPAYLNNAAKDSLVDPWGMFNRECVSYTAWKVYQTYGNMPYWGGRGNASQWLANAVAYGIPNGSTPKVGSVGVILYPYAGILGHVVWVQQVSADGSMVYISQYNTGGNGLYSERWMYTSTISGFIYFGQWK